MGSFRSLDASIILNIHREAVFLKRTLLSLDAALDIARANGLSIELVAVLDRSNDATRAVLAGHDLSRYGRVDILEVDNGSLGLSRNDGIARAQAELILTADADDLISSDFLVKTIITARRAGPDCLIFPEYLFAFGASYHIWAYRDLTTVTPLAFIDMHPFISRVCGHREIFSALPFADVQISSGYAYEDWHFNSRAAAAGFDMSIAPGTILFYRQRPGSLLRQSDSGSTRQIPPSPLFDPKTYIEICAPYYNVVADAPGATKPGDPPNRSLVNRPDISREINTANAIEPLIALPHFDHCPIGSNSLHDLSAGVAYYDLCQAIGDTNFDEVFLLPFMARGGAEKYFLELLDAMYASDPLTNTLLIFGENCAGPSWEDRVPPNATILDLGSLCSKLSLDQRCLLTLKLLQSRTPNARIHMRDSAFVGHFLRSFGRLACDFECIYYHFSETYHTRNGEKFIYHSPLGLIADNFDALSMIVCDSMTMINSDRQRIGFCGDKWQCLYAPVRGPTIATPRAADAACQILWASRLDSEKRPELLPLIARRLERQLPSAHIHVHGGGVFGGFQTAKLKGLRNLTFHGAYNGFDSLPTDTYSIFMYTSYFDGIPNTILEAMSHGMAVIAPAVGGIPEVVIDGETGLLLPNIEDDEAMAEAYVRALLRLHRDPSLIESYSNGALALIERQHSYKAHRARVAELFSPAPRPAPAASSARLPEILCHG
ncbi:Glycosyl transferase family 2 [Chelatococcus asaccharovorans]|nr:Glycosyl transferase family 2 [Chelatococcus asaccharovorans]CAH1684799.1 Glycosyl transferase family 2 [Chelatococcus asaccharovorans]